MKGVINSSTFISAPSAFEDVAVHGMVPWSQECVQGKALGEGERQK